MLSMQPFYAMLMALAYVGLVYLSVRKEKKPIAYSITAFSGVLQGGFLFLWLRRSVYLMTTSNVGFDTYADYYGFIEVSYFVLAIVLLLILAWYGGRKILKQKHFPVLRVGFLVTYIAALFGVLIIGHPAFILLYYGFAP